MRDAAGERFEQIELSSTVFAVAVTEKPEYAAHALAERMKMTPQEVLQHLPILIGSVKQIAETLLKRREKYGISSIDIIKPPHGVFRASYCSTGREVGQFKYSSVSRESIQMKKLQSVGNMGNLFC